MLQLRDDSTTHFVVGSCVHSQVLAILTEPRTPDPFSCRFLGDCIMISSMWSRASQMNSTFRTNLANRLNRLVECDLQNVGNQQITSVIRSLYAA